MCRKYTQGNKVCTFNVFGSVNNNTRQRTYLFNKKTFNAFLNIPDKTFTLF